VSEYGLCKLVELWHHSGSDGFLYYAFRPPWVKRKVDESYNILHPELLLRGAQKGIQSDRERKQIKDSNQVSPLRITEGAEKDNISSTSNQPSSSYSNPTINPYAAPSGLYQSPTSPVNTSSLSAEERDQLESLMSAFDAGLQNTKKGTT
jgi:hypothetical protein